MNNKQNKVNARHQEAMELAEMAFFAKRNNELSNFWKFTVRALNHEKAAARELRHEVETEPTRSILYLGAARLALQLDNFEEAVELLNEASEGNPFEEIQLEIDKTKTSIGRRKKIREQIQKTAQGFIENGEEDELNKEAIARALHSSIQGAETFFGKETLDVLLNRIALQVHLENKNLVFNSNYQFFDSNSYYQTHNWLDKKQIPTTFWNSYKDYLDLDKNYASSTIRQLDKLTNDILNRLGDPTTVGAWNKRGMVVGDVQSGKTSNYVGLINKAADSGFRLIIVLTGLYENLRQQTQERIDEGFVGRPSQTQTTQLKIGVGNHRKENPPVHPLTNTGDKGDLSLNTLRNHPLNTNDWYVLAIKKNYRVLEALLTWLYEQAKDTDEKGYKIIRNIPLLIIDDEADYASINVDKNFVSKINGYIRATLGLFQQSAFIGYTATPYANVFISDRNETSEKEMQFGGKSLRLGEDLFPKDFIVNLPSPSNYIGYSKVFGTELTENTDEDSESLPMIRIIDDFENQIPQKHKKDDILPSDLPASLKEAIQSFILVIAIRLARGQKNKHNSMLLHVSWYVRWINHIAKMVDEYVKVELNNSLRYQEKSKEDFKKLWEREFSNTPLTITDELGYEDTFIIDHDWEEIESYLHEAVEKIQTRAVHGPQKNLEFKGTDLDYNNYANEGLCVIAVGGNKLSRGLTLEGLSISYFLRATRFYDTLMQMGRWFGYRLGYADLCRLYTTKTLVNWYQFIGNATEELKEEFDIMGLADRTPEKYGLKVRRDQGTLMISAANKTRGGTNMELSLSGHLLETYTISKSEAILKHNLNQLVSLFKMLGTISGISRQKQSLIWENVEYSVIDRFLNGYKTGQRNIHPNHLRGYIGRQQQHRHLTNWTVVVINNSDDLSLHEINIGDQIINIGKTLRSEDEKRSDSDTYIIKKGHIISPPHEYLDMNEDDIRYQNALDKTQKENNTKSVPGKPLGKYVRKFRGPENALLIIYLLDPKGFNSQFDIPAVGYAISLPEINNDDPWPYMVNDQFIEELFGNDDPFEVEEEAIENPEVEQEEA